ncbi:hypothetical protein [Natronosalvus rutilus]|uniref:Uncharacterized protein n=1 Tax=Natronosalvus rutilus TaxID=2953753 RepID=A0A9E7SUJ5_9EURY|nr:hypothetical protein [Natronosalvus rutilus]UTF54849.1 hypothetical protein NGM29_06190 [Natronosalvus rutilus]
MNTNQQTYQRRTALRVLALATSVGLAGCTASDDSESATESNDSLEFDSRVEGTQLVLAFKAGVIDQVNVVDPSGELFVTRTVEAGVSRLTVEIGAEYTPGTYEVVGLAAKEVVETQILKLEPDLELTELRLGKEYPEEMYEGATESDTNAEAILSVTNTGTGPTAVTQLRFRGDVPLPTHESYDETGVSGIYDPENDFGADADAIVIPAGETVLIYSNTWPFSPTARGIDCDLAGEDGHFTVELFSIHHSQSISLEYKIQYAESDTYGCSYKVEKVLP